MIMSVRRVLLFRSHAEEGIGRKACVAAESVSRVLFSAAMPKSIGRKACVASQEV